MLIGSKDLIRNINTHNVLETIITKAPISRIDLAAQTGVTKGTISTLVQHLIDNHLVIETDSVGSGVGRKKLLLELSPYGGFCISVDFQKNKTKFLSADLCGQKIEVHTCSIQNTEEIIKELESFINRHYEIQQNRYKTFLGISITFEQDLTTSIDFLTFAQHLKKQWQVPIHLFHRGHLAVLGENAYAIKKDFVLFFDNSNIPSLGVINNGHLFLGKNNNAGNIKDILLYSHNCEKKVYLEHCISLSALLTLSSEKLGRPVDCDKFLYLLHTQHPIIQSLATNYIQNIGQILHNLISLFDPDILVFYCPMVNKNDELFLRLRNSLGKNKSILYPSMLKEDAALYGGIVYTITSALDIERFTPSSCYFRNMKFV